MYIKKSFGLLLVLFAIICASCSNDDKEIEQSKLGFVHRSGNQILDENNEPLELKGIAFGNEVWNDATIPTMHHSMIDFKRVKDMNMNVIRFYLNYSIFEDDSNPYEYKKAAWDWIDKNITWAKKYGIYLILNMHVPQGGYQSSGNGDALWTDLENQNRLIHLWKTIAEKYANEQTIIGFGLVNEPVPTSSLMQWQNLAQQIVNAIRTVNTNHIVFVEKANFVKGNYNEDANLNFPIIQDENLVYEFHFYKPLTYTHQLFNWAHQGEGGKYPDNSILISNNRTWYTATFNNPILESGNSDWIYFEGLKYKITDPKIKIGGATLVGENVQGKVYFDDIVIKEYDALGNFVKDVFNSSLDTENGWSYWSKNNTGTSGLANLGRSNDKSLFIENATSDCNLSNYTTLFIPQQNYSYQINGWMKGENVSENSSCKLRIDFSTTSEPLFTRNKEWLEFEIKKYVDWATNMNTPLYLGEYGEGVHCFKNEKGGINWVNDVIDICLKYNLHSTYHTYHEDNFGLYYGNGSLPTPNNSNNALIDLFKSKF